MKRKIFLAFLLQFTFSARLVAADNRFIVRDAQGLASLQVLCLKLGCAVSRGLDGNIGQVFLVTTPDSVNPTAFLAALTSHPEVGDAEPDRSIEIPQAQAGPIPSALWDSAVIQYYGVAVWHGYASQPAAEIIRLMETQARFGVTGSGVVAVIDTGVDPNHPVLHNVLVPGYDFTRNQNGQGSEMGDVTQSTMAVVNDASPFQVNESTLAVVSPVAADTLQKPPYAAFGHGTMVAGVIHLVAPTARIMSLKAFHADGTAYLSDVLRAVYYSTQKSANIINMSFSFPIFSLEMKRAVSFANQKGIICVASAGNDGKDVLVYPAAYIGLVMDIASTANNDTRSTFSNYGRNLVWLAAPGEGIITSYPFGTYAAGWGTSFSAPFVSGAAAVLRSVQRPLNEMQASKALAHADYISPDLGNGRLDLYQAVVAVQDLD